MDPNLLRMLEQQFGVKWDWDAFWKNAEMYNESSRCMIEKWDVNCTEHPQVCGAALALLPPLAAGLPFLNCSGPSADFANHPALRPDRKSVV